MKKIYLAGPDVFYPNPIEIGIRKKVICANYGFQGAYPFDNEITENLAPRELAFRISQMNEEMMQGCDMIVANLTPFRGPSADVGTVFELGFMRGMGKEVHGYTSNMQDYNTRTCLFTGSYTGVDDKGYSIENFGLHDNLMIDGGIERMGGIFLAEWGDNLVVFEKLIKLLAER